MKTCLQEASRHMQAGLSDFRDECVASMVKGHLHNCGANVKENAVCSQQTIAHLFDQRSCAWQDRLSSYVRSATTYSCVYLWYSVTWEKIDPTWERMHAGLGYWQTKWSGDHWKIAMFSSSRCKRAISTCLYKRTWKPNHSRWARYGIYILPTNFMNMVTSVERAEDLATASTVIQ